MKKLLKIVGIIVGIFILLVVAAAIIIPMVVDPNDYKDRIVALVEKETGRQMKIPGDISLSLFPWLGVKLGTVELSNAQGFKAPLFARLEELQVRVKMVPLLSKRVEAGVVKVRGLTVNLERNKEGRTNWDDLIKAEPKKEPAQPGEQKPTVGAEALVIGGVDVSNASVTWSDEMTGQRLSLSDLSIRTSAVTLTGPLDVNVGFTVDTGNIGLKARLDAETRVVMNMEAKTYTLEDLRMGSDLQGKMFPGGALKIKGKGNVSYDLGAQRIMFSPMQLETSGMSLPPYTVSAVVEAEGTGDLTAQVFDVPGLKVNTTMVAGKDRLRANLGGKLRADLKGQKVNVSNLVLNLPEFVSKESQIQLSTTQGGTMTLDLASMALVLEKLRMTGKITDKALPGGPMPVAFGFGVRGDLKKQAFEIDPLQMEALGMKAAGSFSVSQKNKVPEVKGSMNIARFNLKELLAKVAKDLPKTADPKALSSAELSVAFVANPKEVKAEKIALNLDDTRLTGSAEVKNFASPDVRFDLALDRINLDRYLPPKQAAGSQKPAAATPATGPGAAAAGALPIEDLRKLSMEGNLRVSDLTVSGMKMSNFATGIRAKGGVIRMHPITAALYEGTYNGSVALDVRTAKPKISFDEKLSKARLDRLLKDVGVQAGGVDLAGPSDLTMKGAVTSDADFKVLVVDQLAAAGNLAGKMRLGMDAGGTLLDMKAQTFNAETLKLTLGDMNLLAKAKVTDFSTKPSFSADISAPTFNLRQILTKIGKQPIETADPKAMTQVELNASVRGSPDALSVETLKVRLDDTRMEGKADIALQPAQAYTFDMRVDAIDLDRYLPPPKKGPKTGAPKGAKPGSQAGAPAPLPLEQLRALNLAGTFALGKVKVSNLRLQDIQVQARAKDGLITLDPMSAALYGGTSKGKVSIDARGQQPKLALEEQLANVQSGPLFKDLQGRSFVTGLAASGMKLTAVGADRDEITRTLNGNVDFRLTDGTIEGLNILGKICRTLTAFSAGSLRKEDLISSALQMASQRAKKDEQDSENRTRFSEMGGSMVFRNGVGTNNDLILKSPLLRVEGAGTLDLPNQQINYKATAALVKSCEGQGGKSFGELANYPIPVSITGPIDNPDVKPNLTSGIIQMLGKRATGEQGQPAAQQPEQQMRDRITPLLQSPTQPPPQQPVQPPPEQEKSDRIAPLLPAGQQPAQQQPAQQAPPPKSPKEQREDAARDLLQKGLQDLFRKK